MCYVWFQGDDEHVYKSFLDILNEYRKEIKSDITKIYKVVCWVTIAYSLHLILLFSLVSPLWVIIDLYALYGIIDLYICMGHYFVG